MNVYSVTNDYCINTRNGSCVVYYPSGVKKIVFTRIDGIINGECKHFSETGEVELVSNYVDGKKID
jgi:antitoxin component YwqK of YwqJK toxin-antitoxin module